MRHKLMSLFYAILVSTVLIICSVCLDIKPLFMLFFSPMDILTRDTSISYAAAYAATLHLVFSVIFEQKFAFVNYGPKGLNSLIVVASMIVYGLVYFPIFACLAIGSVYGYFIGSIYVWIFTILSVYQNFQCAHTYDSRTLAILVVRSIPEFVCFMYLCISIPGRFIRSIKQRRGFFDTIQSKYKYETMADIRRSYVGRHVQKLLQRPQPKPEPPTDTKEKLKATLIGFWHKWVYQRDEGFQYSSRFQSVIFVGLMLIYMLSIETLALGLSYFDVTLVAIIDYIKRIEKEPDSDGTVEFLYIIWYIINSIRVSFIISITLTIILNLVSVLHMMSSYRKNLKDLHRGDHSHIPPAEKRSNSNLLVGSIRYAGYQVAYIAWGFVIQSFIFFLIGMLIAILVLLFQFGETEWFYSLLIYIWPIVLSAIIINVLQILLAKFFFLQNKGSILAFENRRMLFSFTYFMFFYNVFLGLVSCLLRILKAIVLGALLLSRLDNSTLPERFQFFDPGFAAYVGYMHIENSHNHPVVLVLIRMLYALRRTKLQSYNITNKNSYGGFSSLDDSFKMNYELERKRSALRFNWHLSYTLINNPELRLYRKGYLQAVRKARQEGTVIGVSDVFSTDLSLINKTREYDENSIV